MGESKESLPVFIFEVKTGKVSIKKVKERLEYEKSRIVNLQGFGSLTDEVVAGISRKIKILQNTLPKKES